MWTLDMSRTAAPTKIGLLKRIVVLAMLTRVRFEFIILNSLKFGLEISRLDCFSFVAKTISRLLRKFSTDFPYI